MEHKRQRVQFGWVCLKARKKGVVRQIVAPASQGLLST